MIKCGLHILTSSNKQKNKMKQLNQIRREKNHTNRRIRGRKIKQTKILRLKKFFELYNFVLLKIKILSKNWHLQMKIR